VLPADVKCNAHLHGAAHGSFNPHDLNALTANTNTQVEILSKVDFVDLFLLTGTEGFFIGINISHWG